MIRAVLILTGLAFVACEVEGTREFMTSIEASPYVLVMAMLTAAVTPGLMGLATYMRRRQGLHVWPWIVRGVWIVAALFILACATWRTGTASDNVDAQIASAAQRLAIAESVKARQTSELDAAIVQRDLECNGKGQKGGKCDKERANVAAIEADLKASENALVAATARPISNSLYARIEHVFGFSKDQVSTYFPLILPAIGFLLGTAFLTGGLHTPKTQAPLSSRMESIQLPANTAPALPPPEQTNVVSLKPKPGSVAKFAIERLHPEDSGRLDVLVAFRAYQVWCVEKGLLAAGVGSFAEELARLCRKTGIEIEHDDQRTYCLGVGIA